MLLPVNEKKNKKKNCWSVEHKWNPFFYPECSGLPSQSALGSKNMCHAGLSQPGGCGLEGRESGGGEGGGAGKGVLKRTRVQVFQDLKVLHPDGLKKNQEPETSWNFSLKKEKNLVFNHRRLHWFHSIFIYSYGRLLCGRAERCR